MTHAFTLSNGAWVNISLNPLERRSSSAENMMNVTTEIQLTLSDEECPIRKPESVKNAV